MSEGSAHKKCYGTMLPDMAVEPRVAGTGKVGSYEITYGTGLGPPHRKMKLDRRAWDDCCACSEFDSCHKFCMMNVAFSIAVHQE